MTIQDSTRRPDGCEGVTVTAELLSRADRLVFLVVGNEKAEAVKRLCAGRKTLVAAIAAGDHPRAEVWYADGDGEAAPAEAVAEKKGDKTMAAKCGSKSGHKGHLCVLASEEKFGEIKELTPGG